MRNRLLAVTTIVAFLLPSAAEEDKEPDRLKVLRDSFEREVERVTSPVEVKYLAALRSLKQSYTKAGNLEDALSVEQEIARVEGTDPAAREKALREYLTSSNFVLRWGPSKDKKISFLEDGSVGVGKSNWENRWKVDEGELHILKEEGATSWIFSFDHSKLRFEHSTTPHELSDQTASLRITKG